MLSSINEEVDEDEDEKKEEENEGEIELYVGWICKSDFASCLLYIFHSHDMVRLT